MKISIRRVDTSDPVVVIGIREMDKECFPRETLCDPTKGAWWVAYCDRKPVGYCGIQPSYKWQGTGYLCRAGVLPAHRGFGLQKRLIRVRLKYASEAGWKWVVTDTSKENVASSNSLITCGFKLFRPSYPWSFDSALYFRKQITSR